MTRDPGRGSGARAFYWVGATLVCAGIAWLTLGLGVSPLAPLGTDAGSRVMGLVVLPGIACLVLGLRQTMRHRVALSQRTDGRA